MILKTNYILDAYPSTRDLIHLYSPRVNCHVYYFCAFGCHRVALIQSRKKYVVVCAGWLPDFFETDLLPKVGSKFWLRDFKPVFQSLSFENAVHYYHKCAIHMLWKYRSEIDFLDC